VDRATNTAAKWPLGTGFPLLSSGSCEEAKVTGASGSNWRCLDFWAEDSRCRVMLFKPTAINDEISG